MGNDIHHTRLASEKREAAIDENLKHRYTVVGDLAIKAVEQAIEAAASRENLHFHLNPRTAHTERIRWFKEKFSGSSKYIDALWGAYGTLGYEGADGERAKRALDSMEKILNEISKRTGLRFK
ncbi:MAG: hypothetical protein ACUVTM_05035 [Candidatus Bathyarchaeia archaeon]